MTGIQALVRLPLDAAAARPRRRAEHGRLRHRLSRLAARRLRPAAGAGASRCSTRTTSSTARPSTRTWPPPPARARSRSGSTARAATTACSRSGTPRGPASTARGDAIRHGNLFGTAAHGRRAAAAGRRPHLRELSTTAHQSEYAMVDAHGAGAEPGRRAGDPGVRPARHRHVALHGRLGGAQVRPRHGREHGLDPGRPGAARDPPARATSRRRRAGSTSAGPTTASASAWRWRRRARVHTHKLDAARAFARANRLDRVVLGGEGAWLGVVTTGKSWLDVIAALDELGIDEARARELGLLVYKVGMTWPLEPQGLERGAGRPRAACSWSRRSAA